MSSDTETQQVSTSFAKRYRNELGLVIALVLVVIGTIGANLLFHGTADYLNEPTRNLKDILHQTALLGIFALGAAIVIISGGIDLSSGSMIVFAGSICGLVMLVLAPKGDDMLPDATDVGLTIVSVAILLTMSAGLMVGTVHTWLITIIRLPPFVATLASLVGLRSLAKILNQAVTAQLGNQVTTVRADDATFAYLSEWWVALLIFIVLGIACWFLMNATVVGRHLYAMGGNEEAARLSGIRTDLLKWLAYCIGSVTAAIAGVLYTAKVGSANPSTLAVGYELNAIAAAVVGGCSLQGGVGLIPGVMLGVLFLRLVIDAVAKIVRAGSDDYQGMIVGFLVVLAVAFNELRRQSSGVKKDFFPGVLGIITIPILALLVGTVIFVMTQKNQGITVGVVTGLSVAAILSAQKIVEMARTKRA
ncbi:MAG: ABC transporter permease [Pirellulaceae bacterium]|nr:ABC transporter permease [Pirellulaceae bacterium]